jgi:glycosyltransferase involved in cell wall biosynthesis
MSDVLFVHNNFPAQFGFIANALKERGHHCAAIASESGRQLDGIDLLRWTTKRGTTPNLLPAAVRIEADLIRGGAAAEAALKLARSGFDPAVIIGHPGWGETIYLREIFPRARQVLYAEYYYRSQGGDVGFDPEFSPSQVESPHTLCAKNAGMALAFAEAEAIIAPTSFQKSRLPLLFQSHTRIIHEGVDTDFVKPRKNPKMTIANGKVLDGSKPVVTLINRRFEPLRGFHIFMRSLPRLMKAIPEVEIVVIGTDAPGGYGTPAKGEQTWGHRLFSEVSGKVDGNRIHFVGRLPYEHMIEALSLSTAHVFYTYPFVLCWSLLEAMASECLIVASDTAPVRDAVTDRHDGILLDFFDVDALSDALIAACREPARFAPLRRAARHTIMSRFDRATICQPAWLDLVMPMLEAA